MTLGLTRVRMQMKHDKRVFIYAIQPFTTDGILQERNPGCSRCHGNRPC